MEIETAKSKLESDRRLWPPSSRNTESASRLRFLASRFPILAETPHGFAQAHRQRRDGLEALLAAAGKSSIIFFGGLPRAATPRCPKFPSTDYSARAAEFHRTILA